MTDDDLKRLLDASAAESRDLFELLRHEIQLVGEGLTQTREALGREAAAETQSMVTSHTPR